MPLAREWECETDAPLVLKYFGFTISLQSGSKPRDPTFADVFRLSVYWRLPGAHLLHASTVRGEKGQIPNPKGKPGL